jgi:RNA polymerase sigma-70 factor (ECF subfamily)
MQAEATHLALLNFRKANFPAASPALRQEESLLAKIAKADDKAFEQLLAQTLPRVQAIAWRIVKSHAEAEDIAQETFLRLWREAPSLGDVPVEPWLYRVASNLAIDRYRRKKPELMEVLPETSDGAADQETQMRVNELSAEVDAAIAELPDRQRLALILVHFEEVNQKTAAQTLGITVEALESLLSRARRSLKEKLKNRHADMLSEFETLG